MALSDQTATARILGLLLVLTLVLGFAVTAQAKPAAPPTSPGKVTSLGYRANQKGNGTLNVGWTGGNLGNTWAEGEWVPYQLVIEGIAPGLAGLDSIVVSFDFTRYGGGGEVDRFVDLIRGIQVSTTPLDDDHAWVAPGGTPFPVTTREEIETAQNHPLENVWIGFTLLGLPNEQINRTLSGDLDIPPGEERHTFKIYKQDLLDANIDINAATVVVYYQLHESRTFIWENQLQAGYNAPPTDQWGGYLYGTDGWPTAAAVLGSGYLPGASGHIHLESLTGSQDVPIPIPETPRGLVSGLKWRDDNGNRLQDGDEPVLSGWEIHVSGLIESIIFTTGTHTDETGQYSFANLTGGATWTIKEDAQRDIPLETGYSQTYPIDGSSYGYGTGVPVSPPPPDIAGVGWSVDLPFDDPQQDNMNFGNRGIPDDEPPEISCPCPSTYECDYTGTYGNPIVSDDNDPDPEITYTDEVIAGSCEHEYTIMRTWTATDDAGNSSECVQEIYIIDYTAPTVACAPDERVPCGTPIEFTDPTAEDNCDVELMIDVVSTETVPGPEPGEITHTRCWTTADDCGNVSAQCCQSIIEEGCPEPGIYSATEADPMLALTAREELPEIFAVSDAHPNPLSESTIIAYELPVAGEVTAEIYDIQGRKIATLVGSRMPAGYHTVVWNGKDGRGSHMGPGVYFCRVGFGERPAIMKKLIKTH